MDGLGIREAQIEDSRFLRRAPVGGAVAVNGRDYTGGEFMPWYVPRADMPQVDSADYAALLQFLRARGVRARRYAVEARQCTPHQRIDRWRAAAMPDYVLRKPVLIAADGFIIDGDHRWLAHKIRGSLVPVFEVARPFARAVSLIFRFPHSYAYGDGRFHPVRN